MLKLWCDFNGQDLRRYFLLRVPDGTDGVWPELGARADDLGIKVGDRVILFQDVGDFEVEATLGFGSSTLSWPPAGTPFPIGTRSSASIRPGDRVTQIPSAPQPFDSVV